MAIAAFPALGVESPAGAAREYRLKAAFLYNFVQFIEWPEHSLNGGFCIGILGSDPFGSVLEEVVSGETVHDRELTVHRAGQVDELRDCQLVFISRSERGRVDEILDTLDEQPTLTVSEIDGFARRGGAINFFLEGSRVRFEINPSAARRQGLKISSQLFNLGRIVEPGGNGVVR